MSPSAASSSKPPRRPSPERPEYFDSDRPMSPDDNADGDQDFAGGEDEDDTLLGYEKPLGSPGFAEQGGSRAEPLTRSVSLRFLAITIGSLLALSMLIGIFAASNYNGVIPRLAGSEKVTMDHIFNGTFRADSTSLEWVKEAGDGVFSVQEGSIIKLVDLKNNSTKELLSTNDIRDADGNIIFVSGWQLSPDMKYLLVTADWRKLWRHSFFANYYIHSIADKKTRPLITPSFPSRTQLATWAPASITYNGAQGAPIAYVVDNDLYVLPSPDPSARPIRLTHTNSTTTFNGVPSWVYEEEIFSSHSAIWWSPPPHNQPYSPQLAYLTFDESQVPEYVFPVYNPTEDNDKVVPYTDEVRMRYPKPGYKNPVLTGTVFDLARYVAAEKEKSHTRQVSHAGDGSGSLVTPQTKEYLKPVDWSSASNLPEYDSVINEIAWVGPSALIVKEINRNADHGFTILYDFHSNERAVKGTVVRRQGKDGEEGDDGWVDNNQSIYPLPASVLSRLHSVSTTSSNSTPAAYLDIIPSPPNATHPGYNHIVLFAPASSSKPIFLTSGPWEVSSTVLGVNQDGNVFFQAAKEISTGRGIYSVAIPFDDIEKNQAHGKQMEIKDLSEDHPAGSVQHSYYAALFSPEAGFYVLSYQGPDVPWRRVKKTTDPSFTYSLTENEALKNATARYEAPNVIYSTIDVDGYELNVKELRPPRMDDSGRTKYAVLFRVYGGPFSQLVDLRYSRDWHTYVTCGLNYIIVTVDGRGTGYKGRKLRNVVKNNLGFWETKDQVAAARIWAKKEYVDTKRIGIWGWSYGGFMSSKVVEADAGIHSLAVAVAPVTSWQLYDSIYTERYLNTPILNPGGYVNASISNVTAFHKVDYMLAHGSADDNVHYSNSAHLLDMFTKAKVRNFRFRMFTDSDHGISRRGANRELYEYITAFLIEKWGKGGKKRGW